MADQEVEVKVTADTKQADKSLNKTEKEAGKLRTTLSKIKGGFGLAAKAGAVAFGGLTAAVLGAVNEAKKFEAITTQFEVLTGSAEQATKTVKELQQFAATTPFQFEGIATTAQQLIGFGIQADDLTGKLKQIGDVASAVGQPISDIGLIFGQVRAAGKLTGERLLQFQERAVPIGPAIAKTLGVAEESVKDLVSQGVVSFDVFEKAFASLSEEGGFAFEGMIKQSKTLGGLISTVKDNFSLFAANIGQRLLPVAKLVANQFLSFLQNLNETGKGLETFTTIMSTTFNIAARVKNAFQNLGTVIGVGLATAIESASAAISGNFTQAAEIAKEGYKGLREELAANQQKLNEDLQSIDKAFAEAREQDREAEKEAIIQNEQEKTEIKAQAKIDENELLKEIDQQIAQEEFETEADKQRRIDELTKKSLKKRFDAKRAVAQEDIKASIKENQTRMKEEERFGKAFAETSAFFRRQEVQGAFNAANQLTQLQQSKSKKQRAIGKAAAAVQIVQSTQQGAIAAYASLAPIPIVGPALGAAAAAALIAFGAERLATVKGMQRGGIVEGGIPNRDSVPALLTPGELVVPRENFEDVIRRFGGDLGGGPAEGTAPRVEIVLTLNDNLIDFVEAELQERAALEVS